MPDATEPRCVAVVREPSPGPTVVRVDGKGKRTWYMIVERDPDPGPPAGRLFSVARLGAGYAYTVRGLPVLSCECVGWYARGRCVHTGLIAALTRTGKL